MTHTAGPPGPEPGDPGASRPDPHREDPPTERSDPEEIRRLAPEESEPTARRYAAPDDPDRTQLAEGPTRPGERDPDATVVQQRWPDATLPQQRIDTAPGGGNQQPAGYDQPYGGYQQPGYPPPQHFEQQPYQQAPPGGYAPPGYPPQQGYPQGYGPPSYGQAAAAPRARPVPGYGLIFVVAAIALFAIGFLTLHWAAGSDHTFLDDFKATHSGPGVDLRHASFRVQTAYCYRYAAGFALAAIGIVQTLLFSLGATRRPRWESIAGRRVVWAIFELVLFAGHAVALWEIFGQHLGNITTAAPWLVAAGAVCLIIAAATGPTLRRTR